MKIRRKYGSNVIKLILGERTFQRKAAAVLRIPNKLLGYYIRKNKPNIPKNYVYKDPTDIYAVFKIGYSKSTQKRYRERYDANPPNYFYISKQFPRDKFVTATNIKNWLSDEILNYNSDYQDTIDENEQNYEDFNQVWNIREVSLRFVY